MFVASSAEVRPERERAKLVCERLNRTLGRIPGAVHLDPWLYEDDAVPALGV